MRHRRVLSPEAALAVLLHPRSSQIDTAARLQHGSETIAAMVCEDKPGGDLMTRRFARVRQILGTLKEQYQEMILVFTDNNINTWLCPQIAKTHSAALNPFDAGRYHPAYNARLDLAMLESGADIPPCVC